MVFKYVCFVDLGKFSNRWSKSKLGSCFDTFSWCADTNTPLKSEGLGRTFMMAFIFQVINIYTIDNYLYYLRDIFCCHKFHRGKRVIMRFTQFSLILILHIVMYIHVSRSLYIILCVGTFTLNRMVVIHSSIKVVFGV